MVRVRDIMTADPLTVSPETTIREAMELLAREHVSGAPVVSAGRLLGVISATDLMAFGGALAGTPTERDLADDWIESADRTEDEEPDGEAEPAAAFFTHQWDDAGADVTGRFGSISTPEWNALEAHDVSEAMTRTPLVTLPPDATAESAAELMRKYRVHRVLVVDDGSLVGIVSASDITRAVAEHRFSTREYVFGPPRQSPKN